MCAVIKKEEYYVPLMFHIRWYNIYNYYDGNTFASNIATNLNLSLDYVVIWTQQNCFRASGIYTEVNVKDSLLLMNLLPHLQLQSQGYDDIPNLIIHIFNKNCQGKPVVKDTLQLQAFECSVNDMNNFDLTFREDLY